MFLKVYFVAIPVLVALDAVWFFLVSRNFYRAQIGLLMRTDVNMVPVVLIYLLLAAGLAFFVISPAIAVQSWKQALLIGAFLGCVVYATYDLTNLATLKDWTILVSIVDVLWGTFASALGSVITYFIVTKLFI